MSQFFYLGSSFLFYDKKRILLMIFIIKFVDSIKSDLGPIYKKSETQFPLYGYEVCTYKISSILL